MYIYDAYIHIYTYMSIYNLDVYVIYSQTRLQNIKMKTE